MNGVVRLTLAVGLAIAFPAAASTVVDQNFDREPIWSTPDGWTVVVDPGKPGTGTMRVLNTYSVSAQNSGWWRRASGYFFSQRRFPRVRPDETVLRYNARISAYPVGASTGLWIDDDTNADPGGPRFFYDGKIKYVDPAGNRIDLCPYSPDTWYGFEVRYYLRTQTYDIVIRNAVGTVIASKTGLAFRDTVRGFRRAFVYMDSGAASALDLWIDNLSVECVYKACVYATNALQEKNLVPLVQRLCSEIGIDARVDLVDARTAPTLQDLLKYSLVVQSEAELCYHNNNPNDFCPDELLAGGTSVLLLEDAIYDLTSCGKQGCYGGTYTTTTETKINVVDGQHPAMHCLGVQAGQCAEMGGTVVGITSRPAKLLPLASACTAAALTSAGAQDRENENKGRLLFLGVLSDCDYAQANNVYHEELLRCALAWLLDYVPMLRMRDFFEMTTIKTWVDVTNCQNLSGFSFGVQTDGCVVLQEARPGPDIEKPDFWDTDRYRNGLGLTVACLMYTAPQPVLKPIQPWEWLRIAEIRFDKPYRLGAPCQICFTDELGVGTPPVPVRTRIAPLGGGASMRPLMKCGTCTGRPVPKAFRRGDANTNNPEVDIADPVFILHCLFFGGPCPCLDAMDTNDDGAVNISDVPYLLNWLYGGGPIPPAPGPFQCGADPTPDQLGCDFNDYCEPPLCVTAVADKTVDAIAHNVVKEKTGGGFDPGGLDTGIDIKGIARLKITATGSWGGDNRNLTPDGDPGTIPDRDPRRLPLLPPEFPLSALIGKIGNGEWFFVGSNYDEIVTVTENGRLFIAHCDDNILHNHGSVSAHIEVSCP